jgi:hypothetical protein
MAGLDRLVEEGESEKLEFKKFSWKRGNTGNDNSVLKHPWG